MDKTLAATPTREVIYQNTVHNQNINEKVNFHYRDSSPAMIMETAEKPPRKVMLAFRSLWTIVKLVIQYRFKNLYAH